MRFRHSFPLACVYSIEIAGTGFKVVASRTVLHPVDAANLVSCLSVCLSALPLEQKSIVSRLKNVYFLSLQYFPYRDTFLSELHTTAIRLANYTHIYFPETNHKTKQADRNNVEVRLYSAQ